MAPVTSQAAPSQQRPQLACDVPGGIALLERASAWRPPGGTTCFDYAPTKTHAGAGVAVPPESVQAGFLIARNVPPEASQAALMPPGTSQASCGRCWEGAAWDVTGAICTYRGQVAPVTSQAPLPTRRDRRLARSHLPGGASFKAPPPGTCQAGWHLRRPRLGRDRRHSGAAVPPVA